MEVCNWTRTHNHLVHKRTLNHLAKLACCVTCKKNAANENSSVRKTKQNRVILLLMLLMARKNQLLLKIKNFQIISLK